MKKGIGLLVLLIFLSFTTVSASQPIWPGEITIELDKCKRDTDKFDDIYFDILLEEDVLRGIIGYGYYDSIDFDNLVVREQYKILNPNYEDFTHLNYDGYISRSAYIEPISIDGRCTIVIDTPLENIHDFYLVIYKSNGAIQHFEKYEISDIGYTNGHNYFRYLEYSLENNTVTIEQQRHFSPFVVILFYIVSFIVFCVTLFVSTVFIQKKLVKRNLEEDELFFYKDKFIGYNLISIVVSSALIVSIFTGDYWLALVIIGVHVVGYRTLVKHRDKNGHLIPTSRLVLAQSILLIVYILIVLAITIFYYLS